jgi:hypothetical protein
MVQYIHDVMPECFSSNGCGTWLLALKDEENTDENALTQETVLIFA